MRRVREEIERQQEEENMRKEQEQGEVLMKSFILANPATTALTLKCMVIRLMSGLKRHFKSVYPKELLVQF